MVILSKDASRIFAANIGGDSISIFTHTPDGAGWNQTVVPVGKGPEGLDLTPDGKQLWTAHSRDGGVSILDVEEKKVVGTFDIGTSARIASNLLPTANWPWYRISPEGNW